MIKTRSKPVKIGTPRPTGKPWKETIDLCPEPARELYEILADAFAQNLRGKTAEALAFLIVLAQLGEQLELPSAPPPFSRYPWRAAMADWDATLRAEWGRRAGKFEEAGTPWPDSEIIAFKQITRDLDGEIAQ